MNIDEENMGNFIKDFSCSFSTNGFKKKGISSLKNTPLKQKECIYVLDFVENKVIFNKGFQNVLGYPDDEINFDFIIQNHHPDDSEMVNRISKAAILYCMKHPDDIFNTALFLSYRRKKKDGSYIKVLSESSIYEVNDNGIPTKGIAKIQDISFIDSLDVVNWTLHANSLDKKAFKEQIYKAYKDFFTDREKEVILCINKRCTNKQIAQKLNISENTIITHRKNIFKKANKHNTEDLVLFCKRKGII